MDTIWFNRAEKYLASKLDIIEKSNIGSVIGHLMGFLEKNFGSSLEDFEKKMLTLSWLKKLIPSLSDSEIALITSIIDAIVSSAKGVFDIVTSTPALSTTDEIPAKRKIFGGKQKITPSCLDPETASISSK